MRWTLLLLAALLAVHPTSAIAERNYHCGAGWQESWYLTEFPEGEIHEIRLSGIDEIRLNGARVSREALQRHLERSGRASAATFNLLTYDDETDCALVQEVRAAMTRALPCRERGWCGEHYTTVEPSPALSKEEEEEMMRRMAEAVADMQAAAAAEMRQQAAEEPDPPERR
jgi:hypothetical protein